MAKRLGVSQATVLRAVARGTLIAAATTPGGHRRFSLDDLDGLAGAPVSDPSGSVRLISTGAAARLLGVSQHTVIRACRGGRLDADETTPGGHRRFSEKRIRALAPVPGEMMTTGDAARVLGLTADTLRRAVHRGTVSPAAITPGGHRRFAASQLTSTSAGASPRGSRGETHG